jgi:autotransporter-associated beta strand protein
LVSAPINGLGSIVKTSDGDVILTGNNTFNGGITLNSAGGILVDSITGLGTGTITSSNAGGKVGISTAGASPLTIPNNLVTGTADPLISYVPVLAFAPGAGKTIVLTGPISGSGQLKISGGGDLDLTGQTSNTNTGGIEIGTGRILATGDASLGTGTINFGTISNSQLVASGSSATLTFSNAITMGATTSTGYTANFDTNGNTVTLTGSIADKAGNLVGGALTKLGAGELILSGNLSYSGNTTVNAGTLTLNSANAANDASTVNIGSNSLLKLNFIGTDTVAALYINGIQKSAGTYTAANSSGAIIGTGSLTVTTSPAVTDTTAPVITLNGSKSITVNWGSTYSDAGATATDNLDTIVNVTTTGTVNTAKPGVYTLSYNAADAANNTATPVTRTVTVSIANSTTVGADGYSPLLRYALGANKPTDTVQAPVTSATSTTLSITAVVRVDDATLTIGAEAATDLSASNGATGSWGQGGNVTVTDSLDQTGVTSGIMKRKVFSIDITGASKKFLRLKATLSP